MAGEVYTPPVSVPPVRVPKSKLIVVLVPSLMAVVLLAWPAETKFCDCARLVTFNAYVPATAVLAADAVKVTGQLIQLDAGFMLG